MKKRFLCFALGVTLMFSQVVSVGATTRKEQLQQQKKETQSQLAAQESKIDSLETKKAQLLAEINELDADLVDTLVSIDILEGDLADKEVEIEQTKEELAAAEADRDDQYQDMKKRIQYLYENGGDTAWVRLLLQAENLTSLLNQAEYVQQMYDSDRRSLENYKAIVQEVTDLGNQLESEKAELEVMQTELETRKSDLEIQIADKKAASSDYANQIAAAEEQAEEYAELIRQQNAEIQKITEEEKKAAEEAAKKAAEEAAKKAEEEAKRQQAANNSTSSSTSNKNNSTSNNNNSTSSSTNNSTSSNTNNSTSSNNSSSGSTSSGNASYNPTGQAVVNYACQFVGNPYVWGGESLTNGADCSGFIKAVYAKFGVSLPHSSYAMRSCGVGVSYANAMPGDIICYEGHVAIYMGNGAIVHASNERDGIKISYNAAYRTIVAVRRVL